MRKVRRTLFGRTLNLDIPLPLPCFRPFRYQNAVITLRNALEPRFRLREITVVADWVGSRPNSLLIWSETSRIFEIHPHPEGDLEPALAQAGVRRWHGSGLSHDGAGSRFPSRRTGVRVRSVNR
jgi:hypothetical protein